MNTVVDDNQAAGIEIVRVVIDEYRKQTKHQLKRIFDENSIKNKMDTERLFTLIKKCGYTSFTTQDCEKFLAGLDRRSGGKFISFY